MEKCKVIKNLDTFTATTETFKLDVNNIKEVLIALDALQNGATAPTLANILSAVGEIKVYEGGNVRSIVRFDDLWALNKLLLMHRPLYKLGGGDGQKAGIFDVFLPIEGSSPQEWKMQVGFVGHSTLKTTKLGVSAFYVDSPLPRGYAISYLADTSTTNFVDKDMSRAGWMLKALLVYSDTVPSGATLNRGVAELKIKVNTFEISHYLWEAMNESVIAEGLSDELALLEKFKIIIFDEPLPADNLKVAVKGDVASSYRLVGVYQ